MKPITKKFGSILFLLCTLFFFSPGIQANPSLYISEYTLAPEVFHPGDTGILTVTITNGETTATKTQSDYINSLPVDQTTKTLGAIIENVYISEDGDGTYTIKSHENYPDLIEIAPGTSITLEFTLTAHQNITPGIYTPLVNIQLEDDDYHDVSFPILVKISDETIDIIPHEFPENISSIGATDLTFTLYNHRPNTITDITITPQQDNIFQMQPSKQQIKMLSAISSDQLTFSLIPKNTGNKTLTLTCQYKNGDNLHNETFDFPITLSTFHEVYPILYTSPETIHKGETEEIRLKIYNAKNKEISAVRITPKTDAKVTPNEYFIGSMDADDLYAVTFEINADQLKENNTYPIEYEITFKQDANIYATTPVVTQFTVASSNGQNGTEYIIGFSILILLLFVIIIYYFYRKKRR